MDPERLDVSRGRESFLKRCMPPPGGGGPLDASQAKRSTPDFCLGGQRSLRAAQLPSQSPLSLARGMDRAPDPSKPLIRRARRVGVDPCVKETDRQRQTGGGGRQTQSVRRRARRSPPVITSTTQSSKLLNNYYTKITTVQS